MSNGERLGAEPQPQIELVRAPVLWDRINDNLQQIRDAGIQHIYLKAGLFGDSMQAVIESTGQPAYFFPTYLYHLNLMTEENKPVGELRERVDAIESALTQPPSKETRFLLHTTVNKLLQEGQPAGLILPGAKKPNVTRSTTQITNDRSLLRNVAVSPEHERETHVALRLSDPNAIQYAFGFHERYLGGGLSMAYVLTHRVEEFGSDVTLTRDPHSPMRFREGDLDYNAGSGSVNEKDWFEHRDINRVPFVPAAEASGLNRFNNAGTSPVTEFEAFTLAQVLLGDMNARTTNH